MASPFDLSGRTAVVTGANTGLGQAIAVALAQAGAGIVAVGRASMAETGGLVARTGRPFHEISADLATLEPVARIVAEAEAAAKGDGSRLDILVNNAGIRKDEKIDEAIVLGPGVEYGQSPSTNLAGNLDQDVITQLRHVDGYQHDV